MGLDVSHDARHGAKRVWFCGWRNGDSDGRYHLGLGLDEVFDETFDGDSCPLCSYPKGYNDCRWGQVVFDA